MKVLIAVDSSPFSYQVVRSVTKRPWPKDCQFRVITLVKPCSDGEAEQQFLKQSELILEERVDYLKKSLPHHRITSEAAVGGAAKMIISQATSWDADLIVLGSHGDTGIRHSHIGSVAAAVVNEAPCTVELIKVVRLDKPASLPKLSSVS